MLKDKEYKIYVNGIGYEVSRELYDFYYKSERRITYAEKDLKCERIHVNDVNKKVIVTPSREDSLDRLMEIGKEFSDNCEELDEIIIRKVMLKQVLSNLTDEEKYVIYQIYFKDKTERELAKEMQQSQVNVHKIKSQILNKLHELLEK